MCQLLLLILKEELNLYSRFFLPYHSRTICTFSLGRKKGKAREEEKNSKKKKEKERRDEDGANGKRKSIHTFSLHGT